MNRMRDQVVLVTGAAKGMGRSHCVRLAEEGASVIAVDLEASADDLAGTVREVDWVGGRCVTACADIRDFESLAAAVGHGVDELGRLDAVVANAGVYPEARPSWEIDEDDWRRVVDINLTGAWHTVKATVPLMQPGGSLVIIGSTNGLKGMAGTAHYCASKHGVVGLTQTLANELGPNGIRVNAVHPGSVGTSMILNERVFAKLRPDLAAPVEDDAAVALAARNLLGVPWVSPVDVSNAVLFLLSAEARYVTGTNVVVDAGLVAKVS
ncbi:mycofactocin-coupled SDR family oxidoreductase [Gordonia hankookensis]|uniref:Mycofactocin-coupled SDR family oxidoreductase n=1 Tax=Gordonia hankookensis TaxID=589403 RepID=A0ABR7WCR8_9ACTN|nr:mycofactocin-coupled SDR family oxidoreductase [Gordonia hankookensis]MBD1319637.1 mycofactocin-coupled SDR family oxidoreductase [Gordonia hankookensis]